MKKYFCSLFLILVVSISGILAQKNEIIVTIGDNGIAREEFERIYHKNLSSSVYDNKSVEEYMDMFINFKLKVIEAERLGYDTTAAFINELAGYREQLAKPYLEDREVTDELLHEAYNRTLKIVSASHILLRLDENAPPSDTLALYEKMMKIRDRILAGEPFDKVARETSEDPSAAKNGGYLGWFGAFKMVYPFENTAYNTPVGGVSMPFRTRYGYHILKNEGMRDARGSVKIAHILILAPAGDSAGRTAGYKRAEEYYQRLLHGESFAKLAEKYSDDRQTAEHGGELRWLKSGEIDPEFEDVIYSLKDSGDFTEPLAREYGWHIIMLIKKKPVESFEEIKPELEKRIERDDRGRKVEDAVLERIKKEDNFKEYRENLQPVIDVLDESLYYGNFDLSLAYDLINPVFSIGQKEYTQKDLIKFITGKGKKYRKEVSLQDIVDERYNAFVRDRLFDYEKSHLEEKYPEFRNLMKEYHDGILLFNLTDDTVWSKAVKDTSGLKAFYEKSGNNYMWKERAFISTYMYHDSVLNAVVFKTAGKRAQDMFPAAIADSIICGSDSNACVTIADRKLEKGQEVLPAGLLWEKGSYVIDTTDGKINLIYVNAIMPPEPKKLDEAKGLITADYQTYLESEWIKSLRAKYPITVNKKILKKVK